MSEVFNVLVGNWYNIIADSQDEAKLVLEAYIYDTEMPVDTQIDEQADIDSIWSYQINQPN